MAIFKTAYDTSVMIGYPVPKLEASAFKTIVTGRAHKLGEKLFAIADSGMDEVLTQPLLVHEGDKRLGMAIDVRQLVKPGDYEELDVRVRNKGEFNLLVNTAKLTNVWVEGPPKIIDRIHPDLMKIYSFWITGAVTKRFALEYRDVNVLHTLCAFYYLSLFIEENEFDDLFKANALLKINQVMKIPSLFIKEMVQDIEKPVTDIKSLIELIKLKTDSVRLDGLTAPILISILSSTWFGNNHAETLAVSIEHPPTFVALVYTAINETMYRRVGLSQVVSNTLKSRSKELSSRVYELLQ